jgi:diguanylate cyclase (GGDEF)-like protein
VIDGIGAPLAREGGDEQGDGPHRGAPGPSAHAAHLRVAIAGGSVRAASVLRLLNDVESITVTAVSDPSASAPAMRLAEEVGVFATTDISELFQIPGLNVIIDLSEHEQVSTALASQRPAAIEHIGRRGADMVWDLLLAKKRGEEQERLFSELQIAYDKIRGHEGRLQANKEALERANHELESRLSEIFFTHEFFKALTSYSSVDDVTSLIVDGANGILGAEISAVYLFDHESWKLVLRASQGRPLGAFEQELPVTATIVGRSFHEGLLQEIEVTGADNSAGWYTSPSEIISQVAQQLRTGDTIIGVMLLASATERELSSPELDRLQVIGNQASLALQNALLHEELERLSVTDRLTELYNHGYFQQRLEEEIGRASRFDHTLSLIMLDIDDFKDFNDTFGHPRGDRVLQHVSQIIRENLREMDVAARYGGEEFVVVLPETDTEGAQAVAERIREGVSAFPFLGAEDLPPVHKTISVGVATYPRHAVTQGVLIEGADGAMYRAKRDGKD